MYKVGSSAVPRTVLPSIQQRKRSSHSYHHRKNLILRGSEDRPLHYQAKKCETLYLSDVPLPLFNKKKMLREECALTPPSTPSSPIVEQQLEFLHSSWRAFRETSSGEADKSIVMYKRTSCPPETTTFEPFNIDRFLAEKLLKELDIDPKIALF